MCDVKTMRHAVHPDDLAARHATGRTHMLCRKNACRNAKRGKRDPRTYILPATPLNRREKVFLCVPGRPWNWRA
ncbi:MAG: hypothetical protein ACOYLD_08030 [Anaerohalosphaeraceae bacterium]|jgi:hypothetical protein